VIFNPERFVMFTDKLIKNLTIMPCIDLWASTTHFTENNEEHYLKVTTSYEYVTIQTQINVSVSDLPDGMTVDDLCNYQTSDRIVVHLVTEASEGTPGAIANPADMYSGYKKVSRGGFHAQIIIIDLTTEDPEEKKRKIKRTVNTLEEL
jgi:hypothetical protein